MHTCSGKLLIDGNGSSVNVQKLAIDSLSHVSTLAHNGRCNVHTYIHMHIVTEMTESFRKTRRKYKHDPEAN